MNNLISKGIIKTENGREFTRLVGGFGEDKPCITTKYISDLMGYELRVINQTINNNIDSFEEGLHIIDLKKIVDDSDHLLKLGYSKVAVGRGNSKFYGLSEAGFLLYLKFADGDKALELYKDFIEDYFKTKSENIIMKKTLKEEKEFLIEQKKFMLGSMFMEQDEIKRMKLFSENEKLSERIKEIDIVLSNEELSKRIQEELQGDLAIAESFTNSDGCWDIGVFCFIKNNEELLIDGWNIFREFAKTKWIWC